jgi:exopolysaccharide biosynthesis protein
MIRLFKKSRKWAVVYTAFLILYTAFVLLDTFVIPRGTQAATTTQVEAQSAETAKTATTPVVTDTSYNDGLTSISISTIRVNDTTVYVADIQLSDASDLKTALAGNTFGRNIKETTSSMASEHNALFAINGDYYGFRDGGYVVRNGTAYRDTARSADDDDALVIDSDGNFSIINENETALASVSDAWQVFSFGPALVEDGQVVVSATDEVDQSMTTNPRTAIGQVGPLHYIAVVSDGRTSESTGLSLQQLAQVMAQYGCTTAYNLDGGGSSTMVFNGSVVNQPTTNGNSISERSVSDCVYIGYE